MALRKINIHPRVWEKLGEWLLDISKYIITAVVISAIFSSLKPLWLVGVLGVLAALLSLVVGMFLISKNDKS